jgi:hypothetical protein
MKCRRPSFVEPAMDRTPAPGLVTAQSQQAGAAPHVIHALLRRPGRQPEGNRTGASAADDPIDGALHFWIAQLGRAVHETGQARGADEHPVDAVAAQDLLDVLDSLGRLDLHNQRNLGVRMTDVVAQVVKIPARTHRSRAPAPERRVPAEPDRARPTLPSPGPSGNTLVSSSEYRPPVAGHSRGFLSACFHGVPSHVFQRHIFSSHDGANMFILASRAGGCARITSSSISMPQPGAAGTV